ncbi:MAG: Beta-N-acetylhexosaminidase [Caulobacter sp.]|nr:Beta-N-acetylhexosaminidase [Caulobacter sp.]
MLAGLWSRAATLKVIGLAAVLLTLAAMPQAATAADLTPIPLSIQSAPGPAITLRDGVTIRIAKNDPKALWTANYLRDLAARTRGIKLTVTVGTPAKPNTADIVIRRAPAATPGKEAYDLTIAHGRATITAPTDAGLFYGAVTLWQLMTPDAAHGPVILKATTIHDAPRFGWRGVMLDSARHYQSPAFIKKMIDTMALQKLNVLQWHLTDDQAWRLEIKKYPRLTTVGGWRVPAGAAYQADIDPKTHRPRLYGGVYTQAQVREIVAYAAARHITIVPEIEMPGHALSAILAYPKLGTVGAAPAAIQSDWGVFPYLYSPDEKTLAVLEDVLTEVMALFPGQYIHVGGDEATKDQWKASPAVQAHMKALGITSEDAMQSWFIGRIGAFLDKHHRRLIGWDEILLGGDLPKGAAITSWHGVDGAITAAKAGHDAVLAPAPVLYFDNRQSARPEEPTGRGFVVSLADVYAFDPAPGALSDAERSHILGLQANIWTEHIPTEDRVETMAFPRLAAIAEIGWSPQAARGWEGFTARLPAQMARYRALGVKADDAALAVMIDQDSAAPGRGKVTLSTQFGLGDIRYTLDGAAPTAKSPLYGAPLDVALPTRVRAVAFRDNRPLAAVTDRTVDAASVRRRVSQQLKSCANKLTLNLQDDGPVNGPRAALLVDIFDPCWIYEQADLTGVTRLSVTVGQVPFNFQIGADRDKIPLHAPRTLQGELEIRIDGCTGEPVAVVPLATAALSNGLTTLSATLPPTTGRHDLCLLFTAKTLDPMWAVDRVQLTPPAH